MTIYGFYISIDEETDELIEQLKNIYLQTFDENINKHPLDEYGLNSFEHLGPAIDKNLSNSDLRFIYDCEDNTLNIGRCFDSMKRNETLDQFKQKILKEIQKFFPEIKLQQLHNLDVNDCNDDF